MKKRLIILLLLCSCMLPQPARAVDYETLEDLSLMRISSPMRRADFLTQSMRENLDLSDETAEQVSNINSRYELLLQQFAQQYPKPDRKALSEFYMLSEDRNNELKKVLSRKQYKELDNMRVNMRTELIIQMNKEYADRQMLYQEQEKRAALQKKEATEKSKKKISKKKKAKKLTKSHRKPTNKSADKKQKKRNNIKPNNRTSTRK